jgi:hypothetical protein
MLRKPLMLLAAAPVGLLLLSTGALPATAAGAAPASAVSTCSGVVEITHLAFNPKAVPPGRSSTVYLTAVNCTDQPQQTSATWLAKFTGGSGGHPVGCPEIDPFSQGTDFSAGGKVHSKTGYEVPSGCDARHLQVTVRFSQGGTTLTSRTTALTILIPSGTR